jgi:hypothetical protein
LVAISCGLIILLAIPERSSAQDSLRVELRRLAHTVKKYLEAEDRNSIAVGDFSGPAGTKYGPRIVEALKSELERQGIRVEKSGMAIKGEYSTVSTVDPSNPADQLPVVQIAGKIVNANNMLLTAINTNSFTVEGSEDSVPISQGEFVVELRDQSLRDDESKQNIPDLTALVESRGVSGVVPADFAAAGDRLRAIEELASEPKLQLSSDRATLFAGDGAKIYGVQLIANGQPRGFTLDARGTAQVNVEEGETCELRIVNHSNVEAAVRVTIDGLSVFQFSELRHKAGPLEGEPLYNHFLVPANSHDVSVKGWHINNETSLQFLVAPYRESAAVELGQESSDGVVTLTYSAAWPKGDRPADEPPLSRSAPKRIGLGMPFKAELREIQRQVGEPRAFISFYYDRTRP